VNEGVNFTPRGQISPLGDNFATGGEVRPWGPVVKLRMALRVTRLGQFSTIGQLLSLSSLVEFFNGYFFPLKKLGFHFA
jgi:hypothetical protein